MERMHRTYNTDKIQKLIEGTAQTRQIENTQTKGQTK